MIKTLLKLMAKSSIQMSNSENKTKIQYEVPTKKNFNKPFALKGMILNYNIDFLEKIFDKAIFIHMKRDPLANIESALKARKKQLGSIEEWYSFKIPEYKKLKNLNPYEQVAGQIYYINKAIENGVANIPEHKKMVVRYEEFCENPKKFYDELKDCLNAQNYHMKEDYRGENKFSATQSNTKDTKIFNAYRKFLEGGVGE